MSTHHFYNGFFQMAIPRGTLLAIGTSVIAYALTVLVTASTFVRDASGFNTTYIVSGEFERKTDRT